MAMVYKWRRNRYDVSAQLAGEELERIEMQEGYIKPEFVVEYARPKRSTLHGCFEWDNGVAAEEYRKVQAREIIRFIEVVHEQDDDDEEENGEVRIRAFWSTMVDNDKEGIVSDVEEGGGNGAIPKREYAYRSVDNVFNNDDHKDHIFRRALSELNSFKRKYQHMREFESLIEEIDKVKNLPMVPI